MARKLTKLILVASFGFAVASCTNVNNITSSSLKGVIDGPSKSPNSDVSQIGNGQEIITDSGHSVTGSFGSITSKVVTSSGYTVEGTITNE